MYRSFSRLLRPQAPVRASAAEDPTASASPVAAAQEPLPDAAAAPESATPAPGKRNWLSLGLALLAVYIVWGSTYLAIRFALQGFPPFLGAGIRFVVAGGTPFTF